MVSRPIRPSTQVMLRPILCWLLGLLVIATPVHALQLSQRVDRKLVHPDETLVLTILADQPLAAEALNIRPLFTAFSIGQIRFANPQSGQQSRWIIPLTVRSDQPVGTITLPALQVESHHTSPITLRYQTGTPINAAITSGVTRDANGIDGRIVEGHLLQAPAYPGSTGLYRLRIKLFPGVTIDKIAPPLLANAAVTTWGEDRRSMSQINGNQVPVVERLYIIRPQQPGQQTLLGAQIEGSTAHPRPGSALRQTTPDIALEIATLPANAPALLSEQLQLTAQWVAVPDNQKPHAIPQVGDPLRFQVNLQGLGNLADDLPQMMPMDTPAWKFYQEQNQQLTRQEEHSLVGSRTLTYLAVPQQAGVHPLPALTLSWWNTRQHRQEIANATLPAPTIAPAPVVSSPDTLTGRTAIDGLSLLRYLAGLLVLAVLCLLLWRTPYAASGRQRCLNQWQQYRYWQQIRQGVAQQNAHAVHQAMLAWARLRWPERLIPGLSALPCYPALAHEFDALLAACYAPASTHWQGKTLIQQLQRWQPTPAPHSNPINPDGLF